MNGKHLIDTSAKVKCRLNPGNDLFMDTYNCHMLYYTFDGVPWN